MPTMKKFAGDYEPPVTIKNIADLEEVSVDLELEDHSFEFEDRQTGEHKIIKQKIITIGEEKYKVPISVVEQLKGILENFPDTKTFKVMKSGTGLATKYQTMKVS